MSTMSNNQVAAAQRLPGRCKGDPTRRVLGQAESTQATHTAALKWANYIFKELGMKKQFQDPMPCDVKNENMEELYHDLIFYAANFTYPQSQNQEKEKEKEGKIKACSFNTICNYGCLHHQELVEGEVPQPSYLASKPIG